jgi:RNA polymerase sigma-70 factor (ECF subfamily)
MNTTPIPALLASQLHPTCSLVAPSLLAAMTFLLAPQSASAQEVSLESAPPVVVKTVPPAGTRDVDPGLTEIQVTFSKPMMDQSWSWSTWGEDTYPATIGKPRYLEDGRTCVLPVKLEPGKFYATWLNSQKFHGFADAKGVPAVPYLLTFQTAGQGQALSPSSQPPQLDEVQGLLDDTQRTFEAWTERQFRSFFDRRTFGGMSPEETAVIETRALDALKGPRSRDYYLAINTLGALKSQKAVQPLLAIAAERAEKDCRDRWMSIRALGFIGNKSVVPDLIHLVYHGNMNTRWSAQISLVRLTGVNFGKDWQGWGKWWNDQSAQPPFNPAFIAWYKDSAWSDPEKLAATLAESDQKFFADLKK